MKKILLVSLVVVNLAFNCAASANSEIIQIVGSAAVDAPPDYSIVQLRLNSYCFDTAAASIEANDRIGAQANVLFETLRSTPRDDLRLISNRTFEQNEEVCGNKWRTISTYQIYYEDLTRVSLLKSSFQDFLFRIPATGPKVMAQSYGEIYQPGFKQFPENAKVTKKAALLAAWDDTLLKVKKISGRCGPQPRLVSAVNSFESRPLQLATIYDSEPLATVTVHATWTSQWEIIRSRRCTP